ncbi:tRNA lysidine(34) synthetase TilS [soil metagenome]
MAAVRLAVRRSLADLAPRELVLVACSGGADSLALAAATAWEAPRAGRPRAGRARAAAASTPALRAAAVTVDHDLQPGSTERATAVADTLRRLGLDPVEIATVEVGRTGGPEAAARDARYAALGELADRLGAAAVLLGHTRDDQAETVLLGLARGSGARSLAGMAPVAGRYRRPLLDLDRTTTRAACAAQALTPWEDPHNSDPAYARPRVRSDALPALERALGPGVAAALARTARLLRDDADALDGWARDAAAGAAHPEGGLDVPTLAALPAAVRRRVLRQCAVAVGAPSGALAAVHLDALDALLINWHGQQEAQLPGGVRVVRRCGRLHLFAAQHEE